MECRKMQKKPIKYNTPLLHHFKERRIVFCHSETGLTEKNWVFVQTLY